MEYYKTFGKLFVDLIIHLVKRSTVWCFSFLEVQKLPEYCFGLDLELVKTTLRGGGGGVEDR